MKKVYFGLLLMAGVSVFASEGGGGGSKAADDRATCLFARSVSSQDTCAGCGGPLHDALSAAAEKDPRAMFLERTNFVPAANIAQVRQENSVLIDRLTQEKADAEKEVQQLDQLIMKLHLEREELRLKIQKEEESLERKRRLDQAIKLLHLEIKKAKEAPEQQRVDNLELYNRLCDTLNS